MTLQEFNALPLGAKVVWREGPKSPRAGEVIKAPGSLGVVTMAYSVKAIQWGDGQITDGSDGWALERVEVDHANA